MINENNERISRALAWCKERNIGSKQLNLFGREYQRRQNKASKREKKLNKKVSEKDKEICQGIRAKEFKEMCKEAKVEPGSLAKTVFTESLKSS